MPMAALLAEAISPTPVPLYSLTINGRDVMPMVPYDSISVTEAGPGNVSRMAFRIQDPTKLVTIADYAEIRMWDHVRNLPVFRGWNETQSPEPLYGGQGRDIDVTCYGVEALLDQVIVPRLTAHTTDTDSVGNVNAEKEFTQQIGAYAPVRTNAGTGAHGTPAGSTQALPIEGRTYLTLASDVVVDGMTIRQAFEAWTAAAAVNAVDYQGYAVTLALTVDAWNGLRMFRWGNVSGFPFTDYTQLTIVETPTGTAASSLQWTRDTSPGAVITAVYVKGGNAAGTGWVTGDTTKGRGEAYVDDASILTNDQKQAAALAILGRKGTGAGRGTLTLENFTPINARPGGALLITNTGLGWTSKQFAISQIDKTFLQSGLQNWTVTFFDANDAPTSGPASGARLIRQLIGR